MGVSPSMTESLGRVSRLQVGALALFSPLLLSLESSVPLREKSLYSFLHGEA